MDIASSYTRHSELRHIEQMGRTKSDTDMRMPKYVKTTYAALQKQGLEINKENIDLYLAELDQKDRDKVYSSVGYAVKAVPDGGKT